MTDDHVYEVQIKVGAGEANEYVYYVDHRFSDLPARETLRALKDEAQETFRMLHPAECVESCQVGVVYLNRHERED